MEFLWNEPKTVAHLLNLSNVHDIKSNLAPFFVHYFYENVLSSVYMEDNLMILIYYLIKEEIHKFDEEKQSLENFWLNTPAGLVLEELRHKSDIKNYFKTIILSIVEKLEELYSSKEINFNVNKISEDYQKTKELTDEKNQKTGAKKKAMNRNYFRKSVKGTNDEIIENYQEEDDINGETKDDKEFEIFNEKYLPDLGKDDIQKKMKIYEKNPDMQDYLNNQLKNMKKDPYIFSNNNFLNNVLKSDSSSDILAIYQIDFFKVIKIIDELFTNLSNNVYLIPYSVKCICKMIILLIRQRFPDITTLKQNVLLANFFFGKLLLQILIEPGFGALINNFIISGTTNYNLRIISAVIEKLVSGNLFQNSKETMDYTPFNWYFIDKMPNVFKFFEKLSKVKLPSFIENLVNDKVGKDEGFDYFSENPNEMVFHRSICCSFEDLDVLLDNMNKCQDKLFKKKDKNQNILYLSKTFEKIMSESCQKIFNEIRFCDEYDIKTDKKKKECQKRKILLYFLFTDLLVNKKYEPLFSINQVKPNFYIKELKKTTSEADTQKNTIIKIKNFFSSLLYNYRTLARTDFDEGTTINTLKILKELKKFIKNSNFVIDGTIPSEWYVNSLIDNLQNLPPEMQANDFEGLYQSFENDINTSIKQFDFELLSVFSGKVKFTKRIRYNYENIINVIIDVGLNQKVQTIIERDSIPVVIQLKYNEKEKDLRIEGGKIGSSEKDTEQRKICHTIESFANKFPDISKVEQLEETNLIDVESSRLRLPDELEKYFKIIKDHLLNHLHMEEDQKEFIDINDKIYDYIMEKLYDKIYPSEPHIKDNVIFKQCILMSWAEPKHFMQGKNNYIFDIFIPDVIELFKKIQKEKSPRKKLECMNKIFVSIENVVKFNGDNKDIGVDDQLPILNYAFVKARPINIYTNCRFMNLFIGSKKNKGEDNQLVQLSGICEFISDIKPEKLYNIDKDTFYKNCGDEYYNE